MLVLILPTRPIVEELGQMNPLFDFIDGGLKEVIFEAIVSSSKRRIAMYDATKFQALNQRPYITDFVMRSFANHVEELGRPYFDKDDADHTNSSVDDYISTLGQLEFLSSWLDDAIRLLIKQNVGLENYEVDDRFKLWIGDDILIRMEEGSSRDK